MWLVGQQLLLLLLLIGGGAAAVDIGLNAGWSVRNGNGSLLLTGQSLPSGVYSALEQAGIVESVLLGYNDVRLRWISRDYWTYELRFDGMAE